MRRNGPCRGYYKIHDKEERNNPSIINGSRRKRIAAGSGTTVQEVNKLLKELKK